MPDFCPATSARRPFGERDQDRRRARNRNPGALTSGQLVLSGSRHAVFQASPAVIWRAQRIFPVSRSMATNESLMFDAGAL